MRKIIGVMRFKWLDYLAFRGFLVYWFIIESLPFFVMFFLWNFIYIGRSSVNGFTLSGIITYYFLVYFVKQFTVNYSDWDIIKRINQGKFAQFLYRPLSHKMYFVAANVAEKIVRFIITLPILIIMLVLLRSYLQLPSSGYSFYFLLAMLISFLLNIYLTFTLAYVAFWMEKAEGVFYFKTTFIYYLSGSMIPLSFFGSKIAFLLSLLPFRYMVSFPVEVYLGKVNGNDLIFGFLAGLSWLVILYFAEKITFNIGIKKFSAVGN